ncbi:hypothetical protein [uncultured Paraglaciecola sp.]|uniref:phage head-tail joining protein n=1 Tax=uncultured Paraglaciecola sp. TaxID=1765024 RepID=UPI002613177C|nr:hypothetical protein [uncultured Paraglaciecola sp.]
MSFTTAQLDAIESAIASGELKVSFGDREVVYRSIEDLLKARKVVRAGLEESGAIKKRNRYSFVSRNMN